MGRNKEGSSNLVGATHKAALKHDICAWVSGCKVKGQIINNLASQKPSSFDHEVGHVKRLTKNKIWDKTC